MNQSSKLFEQAKAVIPGGVNSPVRAFAAVDMSPLFIDRGEGAYLWDVDGQRYVDYVCSWGPLILGHRPAPVQKALEARLQKGWSFGAPTEIEVEMAQLICDAMTSVEQVRMCNSGTEATLTAVRLARGYTKRDKILKFTGCYHGHHDGLLVKPGSGLLTLGLPDCAGIPAEISAQTLVAEFNDLAQVSALFKEYGDEIAAVIVEPIAANMNLILPKPGFLQGLRTLCDQSGSVLIFDEVITGFRVAVGGAQAHYQVHADLTCLGKIIGGGMPVGAVGGKAEIMSKLAPVGPVYQAGTLSGNPLAMTAGLATLRQLQMPGVMSNLFDHTQILVDGFNALAKDLSIEFQAHCVGGLFGLQFTNDPEQQQFKHFFRQMLEGGIYLAPSAFEAGFMSSAHTTEDIALTLEVAQKAMTQLKEQEHPTHTSTSTLI